MSGHELRRIEVLSEVLAKRRTEISAAAILGLSTRQMRRLEIELVRSRYADFGPSLAAEVLLTKDGVKISRETLRKMTPLCP
jgi:hypothetical protein